MNALTKPESTAVATPTDNPFAAYGDAQTQRTIIGELLKFSKGEFLSGQNGDVVPDGTQLVANMEQLLVGWIRWADGAPTDHIMGRVIDGYAPPKRNELGDTDKGEWEVDNQGQARDPWQFSNYLLMKEPDGDQLYTFTTSSRGGLNAIGELCKTFGKEMRHRPDEFPIIALQVDSYKHRQKEYGKIFVPVLKVVGWAPKSTFDESMTETDDDDGAPEQKTAPAPASRGKPAAKQAAPAGNTRF